MFKVFVIFCFIQFCHSNPTTIEPDFTEIEVTEAHNDELPIENSANSQETQPIQTISNYDLILTIKGKFHDDFKDKNSKIFKDFSSTLDAELIYVIEAEFEKVSVPLGTFQLSNVLPSNLRDFLLLSILVKVDENDAEKFLNAIEKRIVEKGVLVEIEAIIQGFSWVKVKESDLWLYENHNECQSGKF